MPQILDTPIRRYRPHEIAELGGFTDRNLAAFHQLYRLRELRRHFAPRPSEAHSASLRLGNTLPLTRENRLAFEMRTVREHLQDEIGDERPEQILVNARVERRHVEHQHFATSDGKVGRVGQMISRQLAVSLATDNWQCNWQRALQTCTGLSFEKGKA